MIKTDFLFSVPAYGVDLIRGRLVPREPPPDRITVEDGVEIHEVPIQRLVEGPEVTLDASRRILRLSDYPALFFDFSDLEPSALAVKDFANRYGTIGIASQDTFLYPRPVHKFGAIYDFGWFKWEKDEFSRVDNWFPEIEKMKDAVAGWQEGRIPDQLPPARMPGGQRFRFTIVSRGTVVHESSSEPAVNLVFHPDSLLDALWLQFFSAVARSAEFRRCAWDGCRRRFEVGPGTGKRSDARFCRSTCRDAFHNFQRSSSS